jgi:hypothetical protein
VKRSPAGRRADAACGGPGAAAGDYTHSRPNGRITSTEENIQVWYDPGAMRRFLRIVLNAARAVSLVLCVATAVP